MDPNEKTLQVSLGRIAEDTDPADTESRIDNGDIKAVPMGEAYRRAFDATYVPLNLQPGDLKRVRDFIRNMRGGGSSGVILICGGDTCDYRMACPLYQAKSAPAGQPCPLEAMVIMDARAELAGQIDLDTRSPVIRRYVSELTQIAQLEWRCQMMLAYDSHGVLLDVPAVVTPAGGIVHRLEATPLIDVLDRLSARRSRLLKELAQTEEAKWRRQAALGEKTQDSLARLQAARRAELQKRQGILPDVVAPPEGRGASDIPPETPANGESEVEPR